jgi:4-hydroxy-tetrahydrodipicolinate synthase
LRELLECCGDRLDLYSGDDATSLEFMFEGGKGVISVTANVAPRAMQQMCAAALHGERQTAETINSRLMPLHRDLFVEANPIPVKWALADMGMIKHGIRLPLTPLSAKFHETVRKALRHAGI